VETSGFYAERAREVTLKPFTMTNLFPMTLMVLCQQQRHQISLFATCALYK
jgi:hypothetical protein